MCQRNLSARRGTQHGEGSERDKLDMDMSCCRHTYEFPSWSWSLVSRGSEQGQQGNSPHRPVSLKRNFAAFSHSLPEISANSLVPSFWVCHCTTFTPVNKPQRLEGVLALKRASSGPKPKAGKPPAKKKQKVVESDDESIESQAAMSDDEDAEDEMDFFRSRTSRLGLSSSSVSLTNSTMLASRYLRTGMQPDVPYFSAVLFSIKPTLAS